MIRFAARQIPIITAINLEKYSGEFPASLFPEPDGLVDPTLRTGALTRAESVTDTVIFMVLDRCSDAP